MSKSSSVGQFLAGFGILLGLLLLLFLGPQRFAWIVLTYSGAILIVGGLVLSVGYHVSEYLLRKRLLAKRHSSFTDNGRL